MSGPPEVVVEKAIQAALLSPCKKSRRGVVSFVSGTEEMFAGGVNRPPDPIVCDGSVSCRATCAKRCVHAEQTAIWGTLLSLDGGILANNPPTATICEGIDLLHVRLGETGILRSDEHPSPSCWQCSREVLALGFRGIWLYEHTETTHHRKCIHCGYEHSWKGAIEDEPGYTDDGREGPRCPNDHVMYPIGERTWNSAWRFWPALEFHEQTMKACEVYRGPA